MADPAQQTMGAGDWPTAPLMEEFSSCASDNHRAWQPDQIEDDATDDATDDDGDVSAGASSEEPATLSLNLRALQRKILEDNPRNGGKTLQAQFRRECVLLLVRQFAVGGINLQWVKDVLSAGKLQSDFIQWCHHEGDDTLTIDHSVVNAREGGVQCTHGRDLIALNVIFGRHCLGVHSGEKVEEGCGKKTPAENPLQLTQRLQVANPWHDYVGSDVKLTKRMIESSGGTKPGFMIPRVPGGTKGATQEVWTPGPVLISDETKIYWQQYDPHYKTGINAVPQFQTHDRELLQQPAPDWADVLAGKKVKVKGAAKKGKGMTAPQTKTEVAKPTAVPASSPVAGEVATDALMLDVENRLQQFVSAVAKTSKLRMHDDKRRESDLRQLAYELLSSSLAVDLQKIERHLLLRTAAERDDLQGQLSKAQGELKELREGRAEDQWKVKEAEGDLDEAKSAAEAAKVAMAEKHQQEVAELKAEVTELKKEREVRAEDKRKVDKEIDDLGKHCDDFAKNSNAEHIRKQGITTNVIVELETQRVAAAQSRRELEAKLIHEQGVTEAVGTELQELRDSNKRLHAGAASHRRGVADGFDFSVVSRWSQARAAEPATTTTSKSGRQLADDTSHVWASLSSDDGSPCKTLDSESVSDGESDDNDSSDDEDASEEGLSEEEDDEQEEEADVENGIEISSEGATAAAAAAAATDDDDDDDDDAGDDDDKDDDRAHPTASLRGKMTQKRTREMEVERVPRRGKRRSIRDPKPAEIVTALRPELLSKLGTLINQGKTGVLECLLEELLTDKSAAKVPREDEDDDGLLNLSQRH